MDNVAAVVAKRAQRTRRTAARVYQLRAATLHDDAAAPMEIFALELEESEPARFTESDSSRHLVDASVSANTRRVYASVALPPRRVARRAPAR